MLGKCYPQAGYYTRMHWDKISDHSRGSNWDTFCKQVSKIKPGTVWRHNVAGDIPHIDNVIDVDKLQALVQANKGKRGFTYTHHSVDIPANLDAIQTANDNGFTVNLSADNLDQADSLKTMDIAPIVTIVPADQTENMVTDAGNRIVICPAAINDNVTCKTCKLCAIPNRKVIIGFPAHGINKREIQELLSI